MRLPPPRAGVGRLAPGVEGVAAPSNRRGVGVRSEPLERCGVYDACRAESVPRRMPSRELASRRAAGDIEAIRCLPIAKINCLNILLYGF